MSPTNPVQACNLESCTAMPITLKQLAQGKEPTALSDIYQAQTNIAIWQRELSASLQGCVKEFAITKPNFQTRMSLTPQNALARVSESFNTNDLDEVSEDIAELVDMFCYLFELKQAGIRLKVLNQAMCPKFHVDRVPCRLVTTYQGVATQWLPHDLIDPTKLGQGSNGLPDHESGLYQNTNDIQQLASGDVALLKGTLWQGNENTGLVHRSPALVGNENRLLMTLDFVN